MKSPGMDFLNQNVFEEEKQILKLVIERFESLGGMTLALSTEIGG